MNAYEQQDELMRYGCSQDCCPACATSYPKCCPFHRKLKEQGWSSEPKAMTREQMVALAANWRRKP